MNNKKMIFGVILFVFIALVVYTAVYGVSFLFYNDTLNISDKVETSGFQMLEVENIESFEWEGNSSLVSLTKTVSNSTGKVESKILKYDIGSHTVNEVRSYDSANVMIGFEDDKIIICTWQNILRSSSEEVATKVYISELYSQSPMKTIDFRNTIKINSCNNQVLHISEGNPSLVKFDSYYSYNINDYITKLPQAVSIKGTNQTEIYLNENLLFNLSVPNKYVSAKLSPDSKSVALLSDDGKVVIYREP